MTEIPEDIMKAANSVVVAWKEGGTQCGLSTLIVKAILAERERCVSICEAEREWEGDISEAQQRIERGEQPRRLAGWNYFP